MRQLSVRVSRQYEHYCYGCFMKIKELTKIEFLMIATEEFFFGYTTLVMEVLGEVSIHSEPSCVNRYTQFQKEIIYILRLSFKQIHAPECLPIRLSIYNQSM